MKGRPVRMVGRHQVIYKSICLGALVGLCFFVRLGRVDKVLQTYFDAGVTRNTSKGFPVRFGRNNGPYATDRRASRMLLPS
jgi:hypothetical protein